MPTELIYFIQVNIGFHRLNMGNIAIIHGNITFNCFNCQSLQTKNPHSDSQSFTRLKLSHFYIFNQFMFQMTLTKKRATAKICGRIFQHFLTRFFERKKNKRPTEFAPLHTQIARGMFLREVEARGSVVINFKSVKLMQKLSFISPFIFLRARKFRARTLGTLLDYINYSFIVCKSFHLLQWLCVGPQLCLIAVNWKRVTIMCVFLIFYSGPFKNRVVSNWKRSMCIYFNCSTHVVVE